MAESAALEMGRVVAGRYRVETKLGEGGMGAVYLVRHVHTDESLAMKILHPQVLRNEEAVARFRREARAPAKIASEHVARVTDADTAADLENAPFYVMEYLRGEDLERLVATKGPLASTLVVEYLVQTARALDKAHALGVVHRDLKPENLFLTHRDDGSPCIKIIDFGIARLGDNDAPNQVKTAAGFIFGTPSFMSPEQTMGEVDRIGPATDVWALGLVTFKLLTGKDFWGEAQNLQQLYAAILTKPIPAPSERGGAFGPAFDAWFAKCVARNVEDRFQSAGEATNALAEAFGLRVERAQPRGSLVSFHDGSLPSSGGVTSAAPVEGASSSFRIVPGSVTAPAGSPGVASPVFTSDGARTDVPEKKSRTLLVAGLAGVALALVLVAVVFVFIERGTRSAPAAKLVATSESAATANGSSTSNTPPTATGATSATTAPPEVASADGTASATPTPVVGGGAGAHAAADGKGRGDAKTGKAGAKEPGAPAETGLSRDQRRRLDALQRLCDQGTFNAAECKAKRGAIMRGEN